MRKVYVEYQKAAKGINMAKDTMKEPTRNGQKEKKKNEAKKLSQGDQLRKGECHTLNFAPTPKSVFATPIPNVSVFGDRAFKKITEVK